MIRRFVVACIGFVAAGVVGLTAPAVQSQSWYDGPCLDNVGVTVVVDFLELGGGVNVRCAPAPVASGLAALDAAGVAWEGTLRFPGFVCRIAGRPGTDREACGNTPPASAYWGYWLAPRGGNWCYSDLGPGNRTPPAGTVEGWSFALNRTSSDLPPPGYTPPPPIDGQPATPLNPSDCGTPTNATTTAPTTAPPPPTTARPTPTPPPPRPEPPPGAATTTAPIAGPPDNGVGQPPINPAPGTITTSPARPGSTTATAASTTTDATDPDATATDSTTTSRPPRPSTTTASDDDDAAESETAAESDGARALGTVDLSDDGRGGGGFRAGTAVGLLLIGLLIATAAIVARRRRIAS